MIIYWPIPGTRRFWFVVENSLDFLQQSYYIVKMTAVKGKGLANLALKKSLNLSSTDNSFHSKCSVSVKCVTF